MNSYGSLHCFPIAVDLLGPNQGSANFNQHPMKGPVDLKQHYTGEIKAIAILRLSDWP